MSQNTIDQPGVRDQNYRDPNLRDDQRTTPVERPLDQRPGERPIERPVDQRPLERPMTPMGAAAPMGTMGTAGTMGAVDEPVGARPPATDATLPGDRVRWGGIWAGTLTAFTLFVVLEFLGVGLGVISVGQGMNSTSVISTLIAGLIAFFIGGWVAESTSAARGFSSRLLTGFMVWALVTTLILALSLMGATSVIGSIAGRAVSGGVVVNGGTGVGPTATNVQLAGWSTFIWLVVSAIAAILGGLLGLPRRVTRWRRAY